MAILLLGLHERFLIINPGYHCIKKNLKRRDAELAKMEKDFLSVPRVSAVKFIVKKIIVLDSPHLTKRVEESQQSVRESQGQQQQELSG